MIDLPCGVRFAPADKVRSTEISRKLADFPVKLPDDYARFLTLTNGGEPKPCGIWLLTEDETRRRNAEYASDLRSDPLLHQGYSHSVDDLASALENCAGPQRIASFLPVVTEVLGEPSLSAISKLPAWNSSNFLSSLVPVATDDSNLLIFISCHEATYGRLYHGLEGYGYLAVPSIDSGEEWACDLLEELVEIADSFSSLLSMITPTALKVYNNASVEESLLDELGYDGYSIDYY